VIQGTFGVIQGTFGVIQGTLGVIQGTFGLIQGTWLFSCFLERPSTWYLVVNRQRGNAIKIF
jgi:hypothetical protein